MRARTDGPIAAVAAGKSPHAPLPLTLALSPRREERRGERGCAHPLLLERGRTNLAGAVRRILDGERDEDALCTSLDFEDWLIVATILRAIADPAAPADLAPPPDP